VTIKNQHRNDIVRLSVVALAVLGGLQFSQPAQAQSRRNPSETALRHYNDRSELADRTQRVQAARAVEPRNQNIRFIPRESAATAYLANRTTILKADGSEARMTVEQGMYESLKWFDQAMAKAKRWSASRSDGFGNDDQKINAKAFDAAVKSATYAMAQYQFLNSGIKATMAESFGDLSRLVKLHDLKVASQSGAYTVGDVFAKGDAAFAWIPGGRDLHDGGQAHQYVEYVRLQASMKSDSDSEPSRHSAWRAQPG